MGHAVKRTEERQWAQASSLTELGELTARWLTGELGQTPTYDGPPDPETLQTPGVVPALVAANRAGLLTTQSQPGDHAPPGSCGAALRQRAALEALAEEATVDRLDRAIGGTSLWMVTHRWPRRRWTRLCRLCVRPVTTVAGNVVTGFGYQLPRSELSWWPGASRDAVADAVQVTVFDPVWDRNAVLWPALHRFADDIACQTVPLGVQ